MPAPDVRYVLDGGLQFGHIAGDTHFYFMEIAQDANDLIGNDRRGTLPGGEGSSVLGSLLQDALFYENTYLNWRADNPHDAQQASFKALENLPYIVRELTQTYAGEMSERGFSTMDRTSLDTLDKKYQRKGTLQIMRRSLSRAASDFKGWSPKRIADVGLRIDGMTRERMQTYAATMEQIRLSVATGQAVAYDTAWDDMPCTPDDAELLRTARRIGVAHEPSAKSVLDRMRKNLREQQEHRKRSIKRSVRFLSRLVGEETTRVYIGGGNIRVEGNHAIFELRRVSSLDSSHAGFRALSVYAKEQPDVQLCTLCIYTRDVPLLDHVASLVMHVKAGHEDEILSIGNAGSVHESAYDLPWLAPHLPKKYEAGAINFGFMNVDPNHHRLFELDESPAFAKRRREKEALRQKLVPIAFRHIYDEVLSDFVPLLRASNTRLRMDHERYNIGIAPSNFFVQN